MKQKYEEIKLSIHIINEDVITTSFGGDIDPWQDDIFTDDNN